ncbi:hypothetical protein BH23PLA1_BH23PLA1_21600 [soil metagenome]
MAKRPKYSRWRRLPGGLHRSHEKKPTDPAMEPQRLVLYLPGVALDRAEAQAMRAGVGSLQKYCEALLLRMIEAEHDREKNEDAEARRGRLEGLLAIADDPEYLAEWTASTLKPQPASKDRRIGHQGDQGPTSIDADRESNREQGMTFIEGPAAEVILRQATLGPEDPTALLACLRRGDSVGPESARELLQALADLENQSRDAQTIDRRLAYALHRLAFEGQVLVTDAWSRSGINEATIDVLRLVQEGVDRVLSGEDIRYYSGGEGGDAPRTP